MQIFLVALAVLQFKIKSQELDEEKYETQRRQKEELLVKYGFL